MLAQGVRRPLPLEPWDELHVPLGWKLPDPSSLCIFRGRLGTEGFRQVFDQVVHAAREHIHNVGN